MRGEVGRRGGGFPEARPATAVPLGLGRPRGGLGSGRWWVDR